MPQRPMPQRPMPQRSQQHASPVLETLVDHVGRQIAGKPLVWVVDQPTEDDLNHVMTEATQPSQFDPLQLRVTMLARLNAEVSPQPGKALMKQVKAGQAKLVCYRCSMGKVIAIVDPDTDVPLEEWGRVFQAFGSQRPGNGKPWRIVWFANPTPRLFPEDGSAPTPANLNGGYTYPCRPDTVVVYRKEEATRVLIHELLHAACTDDMDTPEAIRESLTETWAELFLVALRAHGSQRRAAALWRAQAQRIADQEAELTRRGVLTPADFAWRYTVGRRHVLAALGIDLPEPSPDPLTQLQGSLAFTCP
jgi:hypothetical protein